MRIVLGVRQRGGHRLEPAGIVQFGVLATKGDFSRSRQVSRTDGGLGRAHASPTAISLCKQLAEAIRGAIFAARATPRTPTPTFRRVESTNHLLHKASHNTQEYRHQLVHVVRMLAFDVNPAPIGSAIASHRGIAVVDLDSWTPLCSRSRRKSYAKTILLRLVAAPAGDLSTEHVAERRDVAARTHHATLPERGTRRPRARKDKASPQRRFKRAPAAAKRRRSPLKPPKKS